jgi:hypothetical protein
LVLAARLNQQLVAKETTALILFSTPLHQLAVEAEVAPALLAVDQQRRQTPEDREAQVVVPLKMVP